MKETLEAEKQIANTPVHRQAIRIIWVPCLHGEADYLLDVAERTLYGIQNLWVEESTGIPSRHVTKRCYYYDYAEFWRCRGIDAAVLSSIEKTCLCINSLSQCAEQVRQSLLAREFSGAVRDPDQLEQSGRAFVLDTKIDRKDHTARWQAICDKYGVRTARPQESEFVGFITAP